MWYLTSENDNRIIYFKPSVNQVVIGRSVDNEVCNFVISDDASISRKHATLTLTDNYVYLQDLGSRYGTFVNGEGVEANVNKKLDNNDVVKFGKMNSIWKMGVINLITCTSTLKGENLQNLKIILAEIGGILKSEWDETCNYLTMPVLTLTIKVVLALVQGSNIVTTQYWSKCLENIDNYLALPDSHAYLPQVVESTLNKEVVSFHPDQRRKTLFEGKKFIFFARRQYEMYKTALTLSSASPMLLSECRMTISMLCEPDVVVIQYMSTNQSVSQETQNQKAQITDIVTQLKNRGKRVVADAEIGLAILYCSVEKYCNPSFSFTSEVVKQKSVPIQGSKVLAHESQEPNNQHKKENVKIDESLMSEESSEKISSKRKFDDLNSEDNQNPNKKIATKCPATNVLKESTKRSLSDNESSNTSKKIALDNSNEVITNEDNDNSGDMFNFVKTIPTQGDTQSKVKKLNLARPQKRKLSDSIDNDDLFQFVQTEKPETNSSKQKLFCVEKKKMDNSEEPEQNIVKKIENVSAEDITAMRGSKLKELMDRNMSCNTNDVISFKKEKSEDLEDQMNKLNLCTTIVTTCDNLIVKRESFDTKNESAFDCNTSIKNFKTFKKVWPIRRQNTLIQTISICQ